MSSFVYYKFKSQKEPQRVTIDGPHTDVWNLKREIINHARLGDGTDFDLKIYKENSNEEYTDDTEIIPKDSTVLARRLPASAPGKGRAARYVSGKPPVSAKPTLPTKAGKAVDMDSAMTEEERFKAMLKLTDAQWQQKQEEMSHETRVPMQGGKPFKKTQNIPEGEPPHGYICYRCGKKGHWIQACPTNDDANYDHKNRIKRTTGIPRSMLKKIDQADIEKLDESQRQNLMVNADGEYVFAQADEKAWKRHLEQVKAAEAAKKMVKVGNEELQERGLECPVDKRLFVDPMKTPCCGKTYCHNCIENALIESDLTCPGCETENVSLERLEPDEEMKTKIKEYEAEKQTAKSPIETAGSLKAEQSESGSRPTSRDGRSKSPASVDAAGPSKKRRASEANTEAADKLAPPSMKRQKSGESASTTNSGGDKTSTPPDMNSNDRGANADVQNMQNMQNMQNIQNMPNMPNMMMPDMSGMMANMPMNFPMMPFMPGMMGNNMMPNNMMGMNGMGMMPNMGFMPNFNMMNGMFPGGNGNFNPMNGGFNNQNQQQAGGQGFNSGYNRQNQNQNKNFHQNKPHQPMQQPQGMSGVPTGPKSMQNPNYPPTGPAGNKFSNQQRPTGKDEDNAYMRQPVNPHRAYNKGKGKMRQADYREL